MSWPTTPMATHARAIFLTPAGMRYPVEDRQLALPADRVLVLEDAPGKPRFERFHVFAGVGDVVIVYILGGEYMPHGARVGDDGGLDPSEAFDQ